MAKAVTEQLLRVISIKICDARDFCDLDEDAVCPFSKGETCQATQLPLLENKIVRHIVEDWARKHPEEYQQLSEQYGGVES